MKYINKNLSIEGVKAEDLAKKFATPIYCYSYKQLKENIGNFKKGSLVNLLMRLAVS